MKERSVVLRIWAFLGLLLLCWLPLAIPIYSLIPDTNTASILGTLLLYVEFLYLVRWWGRRFYGEPRVFQRYGFVLTRQNGIEFGRGWIVGLLGLAVLFGVETVFGWVRWIPTEMAIPRLVVEAILVGFAVGLAEELLFRGWLWDELRRDYRVVVATVANTLIFAVSHFLKPVSEIFRTFPQFVGLVVLGLVLVKAKRRNQGRLGFPIGLHGGLVGGYYLVNVGQLVTYTDAVPSWVTGIDNNPLAGVLGVLVLCGLSIVDN
ncbi:abortive phage infection protein [Leptolyngbya valderiana BDU 20041]|nr:type II CAAX endopeptidase family protein [Geitlerinema sp. CS-897]OAB60433.1 abortive phage infection protein [Leptolyngbya valderiana BDU 20041]